MSKPITIDQEEITTKVNTEHSKSHPYINTYGELVVPFDCDRRDQWWKGVTSIEQILMKLGVSEKIWKQYSDSPYPAEQTGGNNEAKQGDIVESNSQFLR